LYHFIKNQTHNLDKSIDDVMNHFVYEPKKSTANPADIPFFLSVRLVDETYHDNKDDKDESNNIDDQDRGVKDPVAVLERYEHCAAQLVNDFEENMIRFT
jgi:hypothetical protein